MQLAIVKSISSLLLKIKTCAIKKNFLLIKKKMSIISTVLFLNLKTLTAKKKSFTI